MLFISISLVRLSQMDEDECFLSPLTVESYPLLLPLPLPQLSGPSPGLPPKHPGSLMPTANDCQNLPLPPTRLPPALCPLPAAIHHHPTRPLLTDTNAATQTLRCCVCRVQSTVSDGVDYLNVAT